eukprot:jgi/Botrbrau1/19796/Bobra.0124s0044.1
MWVVQPTRKSTITIKCFMHAIHAFVPLNEFMPKSSNWYTRGEFPHIDQCKVTHEDVMADGQPDANDHRKMKSTLFIGDKTSNRTIVKFWTSTESTAQQEQIQ